MGDYTRTPSVCAPKKNTGEACSGGLFSDECNQAEGATSGTCAAFCGQDYTARRTK